MSAADSQHLDIRLFNSVSEAPTFRPPEFLEAKIDHINVVRNGTTSGRSTIDLVFEDEKGQKYVALITARLLRAIFTATGQED